MFLPIGVFNAFSWVLRPLGEDPEEIVLWGGVLGAVMVLVISMACRCAKLKDGG